MQNADNVLIERLLIHNFFEPAQSAYGIRASTTGSSTSEIRNTIIHSGDQAGIQLNDPDSSMIVDNCTIYGMDFFGVNGASGSLAVRNTIAMGTTVNDDFGGTLKQEYNMSEDLTAAGTGSLTGMIPANQFVSTAGPLEDLHLKDSAADAVDAGADYCRHYSHDIDLESRFGLTWDIGADEYSSSVFYRSIGTATDYSDGDVDVVNGSPNVIGNGTLWKTNNRGRGDLFTVNGTNYTILSVDSETQLTLTAPVTDPSANYPAYTIARKFKGADPVRDWEKCVDGSVVVLPQCHDVSSNSLIADNRSEFGILYDDSTFTLTNNLLIQGSITDAQHTITLTDDDGNRHYGIAGDGVVINNTDTADAIRALDNYITIEWIELTGGGASASGIEVDPLNATNKVILRNNLIHDTPGDGFQLLDPNLNVDVYNNIIYRTRRGIRISDPINGQIFNNTLYDNSHTTEPSGINGDPVSAPFPNVILRNNIVHSNNNADIDVSGLSSASSHNFTSDGTGTTHSPAGFGMNSVPLSGAGGMNFVDDALPVLDLHIKSTSVAKDKATNLSTVFKYDIDGGGQQSLWDIGADDLAATTAVELVAFEGLGLDGAVELRWETASELNNLGFHLYRASSEDGPFERITANAIPGLGSSPVGARYSYRDTNVVNGVTYFYELEDIETTGKTELHGPVSATPGAGAPEGEESGAEGEAEELPEETARIEYGDPSANGWRVLKQGRRQVIH